MAELHARAGGGRGLELRVRDAYLRGLAGAIESERERGADSALALERAGEELVAADRARRVVERIKERRLRAFRSECERREELEREDAAARRYERAAR
jgi:flagellar biosynthesis chaperone FliJ